MRVDVLDQTLFRGVKVIGIDGLVRGDYEQYAYRFHDDGEPIDLSAYTFKLEVRTGRSTWVDGVGKVGTPGAQQPSMRNENFPAQEPEIIDVILDDVANGIVTIPINLRYESEAIFGTAEDFADAEYGQDDNMPTALLFLTVGFPYARDRVLRAAVSARPGARGPGATPDE